MNHSDKKLPVIFKKGDTAWTAESADSELADSAESIFANSSHNTLEKSARIPQNRPESNSSSRKWLK